MQLPILLLLLSSHIDLSTEKEKNKKKGSKTVTVEQRKWVISRSLTVETISVYLEEGEKTELKLKPMTTYTILLFRWI
jgi:hypothetical protein